MKRLPLGQEVHIEGHEGTWFIVGTWGRTAMPLFQRTVKIGDDPSLIRDTSDPTRRLGYCLCPVSDPSLLHTRTVHWDEVSLGDERLN